MKATGLLAAILLLVGWAAHEIPNVSQAKAAMVQTPPEKIRLIPDGFHIRNVGRLADGRLFIVTGQLDFEASVTRDYICTFIFDAGGRLTSHNIELIGERGKYVQSKTMEIANRHLAALGAREIAPIWIRPFTVKAHDNDFGLIPRQLDNGSWRVEFMPGNTLSFYPPWEEGGYDT